MDNAQCSTYFRREAYPSNARFLIVIVFIATFSHVIQACTQAFISEELPSKNGTFRSPILSKTANAKNQSTSYYTQCVYKFIAAHDERVWINFTDFNLRGAEPECSREFLDIYIQIKDPFSEEDMLTTPLGGRYCGSVMPRSRISVYRVIVLSFHSEYPPLEGKPVFSGHFEFIKSPNPPDLSASSEPSDMCQVIINSSSGKREGEFQSLTYPGVYAKGLRCSHKFVGEPNQRVRIEFLDFDLYSGGSHCPLDSVKVYDGSDESAPLINVFCGGHRGIIIFSTRNQLLITFTTISRNSDIQNRGFSGYYEFSTKFVDLDFILQHEGRHIIGSECDQRIVSRKSAQGVIESPPVLYHEDSVCRYVFEGMQTTQNYERVQLEFTEFDLKTPTIISSKDSKLKTSGHNASQLNMINSQAQENPCPDNYVRIYTQEQNPDEKRDPNDYDFIYCNNELPPPSESDAATMLLDFNGGSIGGTFRARYSFVIDYRVPGTQSPNDCRYSYRSESIKSSTIHSPRYPSYYSNNMRCEYYFHLKSNERLLIEFVAFNLYDDQIAIKKLYGYNEACDLEDRVEIYEIEAGTEDTVNESSSQYTIGYYCGKTAPGPIFTNKPLKLVFQSNGDKFDYGFSAAYSFYQESLLSGSDFLTHCGEQILTSAKLRNGTIRSPSTYRPETYEKRNHICTWNITARPNHRIYLHFDMFELEGSPTSRGCQSASVRIQDGLISPPLELCGSLHDFSASAKHIKSKTEVLSITFISTKRASGNPGFSAHWTEMKSLPEPDTCELFQCKKSLYCLPLSLRCNTVQNCGPNDDSDESDEQCQVTSAYITLDISWRNLWLFVGVSIFIIIAYQCLALSFCQNRRKGIRLKDELDSKNYRRRDA